MYGPPIVDQFVTESIPDDCGWLCELIKKLIKWFFDHFILPIKRSIEALLHHAVKFVVRIVTAIKNALPLDK